jgi:hypothetical protein
LVTHAPTVPEWPDWQSPLLRPPLRAVVFGEDKEMSKRITAAFAFYGPIVTAYDV